jgi:hypothetical protein
MERWEGKERKRRWYGRDGCLSVKYLGQCGGALRGARLRVQGMRM